MPSVRVVTRWARQRVLWAGALVAAGLAAPVAQGADRVDLGSKDELAQLNAQIIENANNTELNLRYARLAEARGLWRLALAAYERVLVNDPPNLEALAGLARIRLKLQPDTTQYTAQIAAVYESNPRYLPNGVKGEAQAEAGFGMKDERTLGDTRWRTTLGTLGTLHQREGDLNYAYLGATTGPVLNLAPGLTWQPAIGAAATFFDERFYYGEANANINIEDYFQGLYSRLWLRLGYREYSNFFVSHQGLYADAVGRLATPVGAAGLIILSPWLRVSGINGAIFAPSLLFSEIQPGTYVEAGGKLEIYYGLTDWLLIGANFAALERAYQTDLVPFTAQKRRDLLVLPGASLVFPNLLAFRTDLRIDYRYLCDSSSDPAQSFTDHVITTSIATRF